MTPLRLLQRPTAFSDPEWLFEVKHDGLRSLAYIEAGACRLVSRNGNDYRRKRLLELAKALSGLPNSVLDGELVCLDEEGQTLFYDLMFNRAPVYFYAFDILSLSGEDLCERPLIERKEILRELLFVNHIEE
jgi:bifunctional non-homologous end joining protein LigD